MVEDELDEDELDEDELDEDELDEEGGPFLENLEVFGALTSSVEPATAAFDAFC